MPWSMFHVTLNPVGRTCVRHTAMLNAEHVPVYLRTMHYFIIPLCVVAIVQITIGLACDSKG